MAEDKKSRFMSLLLVAAICFCAALLLLDIRQSILEELASQNGSALLAHRSSQPWATDFFISTSTPTPDPNATPTRELDISDPYEYTGD